MCENKQLAVTKQETKDVSENCEEDHEIPASPGVWTSRSMTGLIAKEFQPVAELEGIEEEQHVAEDLFKPVKAKIIKRQSSERTDVSHLIKVNMGYTISYVLCYALGVNYTTFAMAGNA